jgi:hypothetical protein
VISDWSEACNEQAEVLDKFERGALLARVWWGESLPPVGLAEAGSRKTEQCRQAAAMITPVSNGLLRLETCRAVTLGRATARHICRCFL